MLYPGEDANSSTQYEIRIVKVFFTHP